MKKKEWKSGHQDLMMKRCCDLPTVQCFPKMQSLLRENALWQSINFGSSEYYSDSRSDTLSSNSGGKCLSSKRSSGSTVSTEKVVEKVRIIFKAYNINPSLYDNLLNEFIDNLSSLGSSLNRNRRKVEI